MKTEQLNSITKATCTTIGVTSTLVRISSGILAGVMIAYLVLKKPSSLMLSDLTCIVDIITSGNWIS